MAREDPDPSVVDLLRSERLRPGTVRDEPDWALVQRITGKRCPEGIDLRNLSRMTEAELGRDLGLSDREAKKLSTALVLGERLASEPVTKGEPVRNVRDVYRIFRGQAGNEVKESFYVLTLGRTRRLIDLHRVSEGTLSTVPVHPRECFAPALRDRAATVIFIHNHTSGDSEPSRDDFFVTARLAEAGKILGIDVLDHVVVGAESFVSLRARGAFGETETSLGRARTLPPGIDRSAGRTDDGTLRTVAILSAGFHAHPKYRDFRDRFAENPRGFGDTALLAVEMAKAIARWEETHGPMERGAEGFEERLAGFVLETSLDSGSVPRDLDAIVESAAVRDFGIPRPEME